MQQVADQRSDTPRILPHAKRLCGCGLELWRECVPAVIVVKEGEIDIVAMLLQHGAGKPFGVTTEPCVLVDGGSDIDCDREFGRHDQFAAVSSSLMRLTIMSMATGL